MTVYQKCPACNGTGVVSRPFDVAGDQMSWVAYGTGPHECSCCRGRGIIPEEAPDAD